ncbi:MAG: hypothetical protein IOC86_15100 [Aestuariivirga sp.]|nr:hypothetical protein [Aestuariivirga sp.]
MTSRSLAIAALLAITLSTGAAAFEKPEDIPSGAGRDETFYLCSACHSFTLVSRQGMSKALWDDTLRLMVERHGMVEPTAEERALILEYLTATYPPPEKRGWQNPFLKK